jgi:hypothetical protein
MNAPPSRVRIISIDQNFVAGIFAAIYAILGISQDAFYVITKPAVITFPIGFIMPGINFSFRLNLPKPNDPMTAVFALVGVLVCLTFDGWLVGLAGGFIFNWIASKRGGIPVRKFRISSEEPQTTPFAS